MFDVKQFEESTLYRALEILGANREKIMFDIQSCLFTEFDFEHTDTNMDWSSLILWGVKANLGMRGYSRDHRPDKKQITFGVAELASPNLGIGHHPNLYYILWYS
jgi:transposase